MASAADRPPRDISPHNLFITYRGKLKVVDFGIAAATHQELCTRKRGSMKGKLAYLSPEQVTQAPVDGRTDVFALGIVLFEALLTLSPLFADSVSRTRRSWRRSAVPDRSIRRAGPRGRYPRRARRDRGARDGRWTPPSGYGSDAEELQEALEAWLADQDEQPTDEELGALIRDLFPERMKRKDALVRASLGTQSIHEMRMADEATATDIDLTAHPELMRLASSGKGKAPGEAVAVSTCGAR